MSAAITNRNIGLFNIDKDIEYLSDRLVLMQITDEDSSKTLDRLAWFSPINQELTQPEILSPDYNKLYFTTEYDFSDTWTEENIYAWGSEIVQISEDSKGTSLNPIVLTKRGLYGTPSEHEPGEPFRLVKDISDLVLSSNIKLQACSISSSLFSPNVSNSNIQLIDEIINWSPFVVGYLEGNAVYYYEYKNEQIIHQATLFLTKINIDYNTNNITLELEDKYRFFVNKEMDKKIIIGKNGASLIELYKTLLSSSLDDNSSRCYFASSTNRIRVTESLKLSQNNLPTINMFFTGEYKTYGDAIKEICEVTGTRIFFNEKEELLLDNDIITNVLNEGDFITLLSDEDDLNSISGNFESAIMYNKIGAEYKKRTPMYDTRKFYDNNGNLKTMIAHKEYTWEYDYDNVTTKPNSISSVLITKTFKLLTQGSNLQYGFNNLVEFTIHSEDFNYFKLNYNDLVIAVSNISQTKKEKRQFYGKIVDIKYVDSDVKIYVGFGADINYIEYEKVLGGYIDFLITEGYQNNAEFNVFFGIDQLPILYQYAKETNGQITRNSIRQPLIPLLNNPSWISSEDAAKLQIYEFYVKFAEPESSSYNFKYAGYIEDLNQCLLSETTLYDYFNSKNSQGLSFGELSYLNTDQTVLNNIARNVIGIDISSIRALLSEEKDNTIYGYKNSEKRYFYDTLSFLRKTYIKIEKSDITENDLKITLRYNPYIYYEDTYNYIESRGYPAEYKGAIQIISMPSSSIIEVSSVDYSFADTGNVVLLNKVEKPLTENDKAYYGEQYNSYNLYKMNKYTIIAKTIDGDKYYFTLDKNFPQVRNNLNNNYLKIIVVKSIAHLNYLNIRANPIVEVSESFLMKNEKSIERFKENALEIKASFVSKDYLQQVSTYYMKEVGVIDDNGLFSKDTMKYIITCELATKRYELDVLDKVLILEKDKFGLDYQPFIIIGKEIVESESESKEILTLINWVPTKTYSLSAFFNVDKDLFSPINPFTTLNYLSLDSIKEKKPFWNEYYPNANGVIKYPYTELSNIEIDNKLITANLSKNTNNGNIKVNIIEKDEKILLMIGSSYILVTSQNQIGLTSAQAVYPSIDYYGKYGIASKNVAETVSFKIVDLDPLKTGTSVILPKEINGISMYVFYSSEKEFDFISYETPIIKQTVSNGVFENSLDFTPKKTLSVLDGKDVIELNETNFLELKIVKENVDMAGELSALIRNGVAFDEGTYSNDIASKVTSIFNTTDYSVLNAPIKISVPSDNLWLDVSYSIRYIYKFTNNSITKYVSTSSAVAKCENSNNAMNIKYLTEGTAFVSTTLEFVGALDISIQYITLNGETRNNPFYGYPIRQIALLNDITLSGLDSSHFGTPYQVIPYLLNKIYSLDKSNNTIFSLNWCWTIRSPIVIEGVIFKDAGAYLNYLGSKQAFFINSEDVFINNVTFYNPKGKIRNLGGIYSKMSNIEIYLDNESAVALTAGTEANKSLFWNNTNKQAINIEGCNIFFIDAISPTTTLKIFEGCSYIKDIKITQNTNVSVDIINNVIVFYHCNDINNIYIRDVIVEQIFVYATFINTVNLQYNIVPYAVKPSFSHTNYLLYHAAYVTSFIINDDCYGKTPPYIFKCFASNCHTLNNIVGKVFYETTPSMIEAVYNDSNCFWNIGEKEPVGSIKMYASTNVVPLGYLMCNGDEVLISNYPKLSSAIIGQYGTAVDPLKFKLPDFRGIFPKGAGLQGTAPFAGAAYNGGAVGTYKQDQMQDHTHNLSVRGDSGNGSVVSQATGGAYATAVTAGASGRVGTTTEPASLSINFIIKY